MFGWKRKDDGFKWQEYVRTTIKLRREDRRQRVDQIKMEAAQKVKSAGAQLPKGMKAVSDRSARFLGGAGRWFARLHEPLTWPGITLLLTTVAAMATVAFVVNAYRQGLDIPSALTGAVAAALLAMITIPRIGPVLRLVANAWSAVSRHISPWLPVLFRVPLGLLRHIRDWSARHLALVGQMAPRHVANRKVALTAIAAATLGIGVAWISQTQTIALPQLPSLASVGLAQPQPITGTAKVLSGDMLVVDGHLITLAQVDAPELGQTCRDRRNRRWSCGRRARNTLRKLLRRQRVSCMAQSTTTAGITVAKCTINGKDIAKDLVSRGVVFARTGLFSTYGTEESQARRARRGIWKGASERPAAFRATRWAKAQRRAPSGCPIKGRIVRRAKIYVLPWSPNYRRVRVRSRRGERWFCSVDDAIAAGFKPAATG